MPALRRALAGARQSTAPVSTRNSAANPLPRPASLRTVVVTCVKPIVVSYGRELARTSGGRELLVIGCWLLARSGYLLATDVATGGGHAALPEVDLL